SLDQMHFGVPSLAGPITRRSGVANLSGTYRSLAAATLHRQKAQSATDGIVAVLCHGCCQCGRRNGRTGTAAPSASKKLIKSRRTFSWNKSGVIIFFYLDSTSNLCSCPSAPSQHPFQTDLLPSSCYA